MDSEGSVGGSGSPTYHRSDYPTTSQRRQSSAARRQSPTGIEQARAFLQQFYNLKSTATNYDLEKVFVCKISEIEWLVLCHEFNLDDERRQAWPRFSFNSHTSTLKIYATQSCFHDGVITFLRDHFIILFHRVLPQQLRKRVKIHTTVEEEVFEAEYEGSFKIPDLGISLRKNDSPERELQWVLEVGFSETYEDLQEDMRLWLTGQPTCSMAVLINITESPAYRCPLDFDLDICDELNIPRDSPRQIKEGDFSLQGEYGPVEFKGYQWVGQISEVYLETWTRNPRTGQPRRRGGRMSLLPPANESPQFRLSDLVPVDDPQMTSVDWEELQTELKDCLQLQAAKRCRAWIKESRKRAGLDDGEFDGAS
ncbi:hypothetical protein Z517_09468 [Fonsecaea pedrosoi CBS 271.37]|uniref:Uncharacterized protein n=1 Tax=Fonsecaea pedrosoi CBS 271.37 TaxID=1442368 RepID=A0A0D2ES16_9EURO|nr:uncharacterized protein Z517_09468 [Fonsecaea pedrosoi CBS 271.37]KIW77022.1 hypothetical protein Z517_09468 [Fonsecaea pedrosoi CBS 271.37]